VKFGFVAKHRGAWPVLLMCEALGVSRSGFYAWLNRPRCKRSLDDEVIGNQVRQSFLGIVYARRYREAHSLALAPPPRGPGYPALVQSPYLTQSSLDVYVAEDGVVVSASRFQVPISRAGVLRSKLDPRVCAPRGFTCPRGTRRE
jgi:hypothetical protein